MQTVTTLPILQTVSDATTHYIGLQPAIGGKTTAEYVNRNLSFNPASNTLNIGVNVNFLPNAVSGSAIAESSLQGSKIIPGTVTPNLFSGPITSSTLDQNLQLSLIRIFETANVYTTAVGGNVNIDLQNNTLYFFSSNTTANVTFNFRANTQNTLDSQLPIGRTVTAAILLKQGATRYRANVYVDGVLQRPWWLSNLAPGFATTQQESIDSYSVSILKTAANVYTVLASNANFQIALNQNP
jgi:hypothetical protein